MRISDWSSDVCSSDRGERADEIEVEFLADLPRQDIGVEEIPVRAVENRRADARLGHDPPLRGQRLEHLAQHGTRNAEALPHLGFGRPLRSAERRVGKEGVSTCRFGWEQYT